ncbi:MAG TPA: FtsX-like permease family protein, partial [Acidimicrobiia bacterium]|nr:FtsX-like permease family protein [Acidimicrobiia bacterium]
NFAAFYDLPDHGQVRVAGGPVVDYVGLGLAPEYFFVMTEEGGFFAQANFAVLFVPLQTAQSLTGRSGRVNDLVLRLRPGVDAAAAATDVDRAFREAGSGLGATVMRTEDEDAYRILYDDIDGDQRFWNVFAALILAGAAFGAFNLASRMVDAQRREIGIGMALGAPPSRLALRPLLVGVQIALLGTLFGVGMGVLIIAALRPVYTSMLPLPVWYTGFQPALFVRGAAMAFMLPLVATAWPVWRAVRVTPVDAIATTHRAARGGLAPLLRRLRWPVSAFKRIPVGNVLRTPRRTTLTALGIGAAITTLVAILGMLDSFNGTLEGNDREVLQRHPDRVVVALDGFVPDGGPEVAAVRAAGSVGRVEPVVRLGATVTGGGPEELDLFLEAVDLDSDVWAPTILRADAGGIRSGVLLAEKAAADLGVAAGDTVTLKLPVRRGDGFAVTPLPVKVAGIHPSPFRFNAYIDRSQLPALGLAGLANTLYVLPAAGHGPDDVERALFELDGVASVQPVAASSQIVKDSLDEFTGVFRVLELFILLLAVLIAYNATSINADERARERATLFAFGLPLRRVLALETVEGLITGAAGTAVGVGLGVVVLRWFIAMVTESTMPDLGMDVVLSVETVLTAVALGVVAVAVAPLLTVRRLRRMDIPGTLRVVE